MERHDLPAGQGVPSVELRIEEVVLHGFGSGDRNAIGEAIERELSRLLADGVPPHGLTGDRHVAELDGGRFDLPPGARGDEVGALIARAVYGGLRTALAPAAVHQGPAVGGGAGWSGAVADGRAGEAAADGGRL